MLRLRAERHGEPEDVLTVVDVDDPPLQPGELRLECHTVGLNYLDVMLCQGSYPGAAPPPFTPGVEVVGRVIETSGQVAARIGDVVLACPVLERGALGERAVVDDAFVVSAPAGADPVLLAALPVNYQTAWFALRRANVRSGDVVLIHAGAGGVGIAATQLAVAWGACVITTAGGAAKVAISIAQGAEHAIDYRAEDFVHVVNELTGGCGADIVLDQVGGETFIRSLDCLAFEGRIVPIGSASGQPCLVDPMRLTAANVSVVGLSWGSAYPQRQPEEVRAVYADLFAMLGTTVRPVIDRVVGLAEAPQALRDLADRKTIGKVVVSMLEDQGGRNPHE